ncbi:MAG: hypothetical protein A2741_01975 [Candidatus Zambryskibacteria bacterium RIFCSPHIGHO2_01_FULL_43_27]|uniref:Nudix hydrolase domain-containing protein n=1 Tax=Candidatus Zambryskibacteria bacterium RIFCSPLOWO2_01_FULL_43_17 TaxID=1802760 RepID=A0A1G2U104_9BACT|nr:MAG: hypothetical protein A2741_01975 [Candidatus Zambryskibacteria bacterium RIFCSPHIGHO2_01_FULL_43_27]OHA99789.1 MAG: hypothetical protein A3E93_00960 [Candidatus Zambryskibacteria bacterium RIFCSPHIGHO2_12_FULL_43_12b]OHB03206.1 MAG: hypothetical protein A2920_02460 [Candidatus Zambryskibacteria bacterium RIFCSPLOWO2_01_FULL_43_17]
MPHIHEKIDFCADVFVVYKDKVLIRKHDKYNIWLAVGGHIELDEDLNEAAVREVKEEVGLDIKLLDTRNKVAPEDRGKELIPPIGVNRHKISDTHEHISFFFVGIASTDKVTPENPEDIWRWCGADEIEKLDGITSNIIFYAKLALKLAESSFGS